MSMKRHDPCRKPRRPRRPPDRESRPCSERERAAWERHLPLVRLQVGRTRLPWRRVDCDADDMFQEGALALGYALRRHRHKRHVPFACYVLARVRAAISDKLAEGSMGVRIPRRSQDAARPPTAERHSPEAAPRAAPAHDDDWRRALASQRHDEPVGERELLDLVFDRYRALVRRTARDMTDMDAGRPDRAALLDRCLEERWLIPDPESRTSIRVLASRMNCSPGRIVHFERSFGHRLKQAIGEDREMRWLMSRAEQEPAGLHRGLSDAEADEYARVREDARPAALD